VSSPLSFPPELPISSRVADIAAAIHAHQVVIVAGATGSGKTTQLPKIALGMGRGTERRIGVTQPRRIAATSVAARVAEELGSPLGTDVGYQIRFQDLTSPATYVKFMTDGILLAEIHGDPLLRQYDTLIIDEAHERSLTIDFLLGWLRHILPERPDLKVIVSSATLETERFSTFFHGAPVIEVQGRTYPVEVLYEPPAPETDLATAVADAVANVTSLDPHGDILVFLPGEREIAETEGELRARNMRHTRIMPLYARLTAAEQARVFVAGGERKVILATNVAETSVTLPGIVYVIDSGVARLSRYDNRSGTTRLQLEAISQASAEQRKGRCGRVREGICIRLYDEVSFAARPAFTDPEIRRTGLSGVILRMKALGLGNIEDFAFLDPPTAKSITEGYRVLEELSALDRQRELTPLGHKLARLPVDPRIARMLIEAAKRQVLPEVLVCAAFLSVQDPKERPRDAQQRADDKHRPFRDEASDFAGVLKLYRFLRDAEQKGKGALRKVCRDNFLSYNRVREWMEVRRQLEDALEDDATRGAPRENARAVVVGESQEAIHQALLSGLLSRIGKYKPDQRIYVGSKQTRFVIHPSSGLARKTPAWVMAFELVETTQLFARMVAKVEPEWLHDLGAHLLKRSYGDTSWSERNARATIKESATLYGLEVYRDRAVDLAAIDPATARKLFIEHALVRGEFVTRAPFLQKNRELLERVAKLRDRARRSDMLGVEAALFAFFDARVPSDVVNGKTFEAFLRGAPTELLVARAEDVLTDDGSVRAADYPDEIRVHGARISVSYVFDPSSDDDGLTLHVPLGLVSALQPAELDWVIPGWHIERLMALLYEVPRAHRRDLGNVPELAIRLAKVVTPFSGPMNEVVLRALRETEGIELPREAIRSAALGAYLRPRVRVVGENGAELAAGRDIAEVLAQASPRAAKAWAAHAAASKAPQPRMTTWQGVELPSHVEQNVSGAVVRSYPALVDGGDHVRVEHLGSATAARDAHRLGVLRLLLLDLRPTLRALIPRVPQLFSCDKALWSRADQDAFAEAVLSQVVVEVFALGPVTTPSPAIPRGPRAFEDLLVVRRGLVHPAYLEKEARLKSAITELRKVWDQLREAKRHPSGRAAISDMEAQLKALVDPPTLAGLVDERLGHLTRYARAMATRLTRAVHDPAKDALKAAPLAPILAEFARRRSSALDRSRVEALRWDIEELRVALFAPELRPAPGVSAKSIGGQLQSLQ
jgi:ATP-dependent helicase HrpA